MEQGRWSNTPKRVPDARTVQGARCGGTVKAGLTVGLELLGGAEANRGECGNRSRSDESHYCRREEQQLGSPILTIGPFNSICPFFCGTPKKIFRKSMRLRSPLQSLHVLGRKITRSPSLQLFKESRQIATIYD